MSYAQPETMTLVTTGMLPMLLLASAVLTAPVSLFLLWLYRRAVERSMAGSAGHGSPLLAQAMRDVDEGPLLQARLIDAAVVDGLPPPPLYRNAVTSLFSATAVYVVAGLTYALVLTCAWLVFTSEDGFPLTRFLWLMSCYGWPTALAVGMLAAVSRGQRALVLLAYFAMLFAVAIYCLLRNAELNPAQLVYFWMFTNAPATVVLLAFLHRRVRAVGPLVLAFMVTAVIGAQVLIALVGSSDTTLRAAASAGSIFDLDG